MQGVDKDLLRDIECYSCGEDPSPMTLLRAPRLENWNTSVLRRGKEFVLVVAGTWVTTSEIYWFDRRRRWIRTYSRLYVLGEPAVGIDT